MSAKSLPVLTIEEIAHDLRNAGIGEGETLLVHSALGQMGWCLGGPARAVEAFRTVLGPTGTLVMPTFSFNLEEWNMPPFDRQQTPSRVGLLTDTFWRLEGVRRSEHPTHSVAAIGPLAEEITCGPVDYEPLGIGSPLDRVRALHGRILLIGVGQNRNSTVHLAESIAEMPYLRLPFSELKPWDTAYYREDGGTLRELQIREMPGSSEGFEVLDNLLFQAGIVKRVKVGRAACQLMNSQALCDFVENLLRQNPLLLLPADSSSEITRRRRLLISQLAPAEEPLIPLKKTPL